MPVIGLYRLHASDCLGGLAVTTYRWWIYSVGVLYQLISTTSYRYERPLTNTCNIVLIRKSSRCIAPFQMVEIHRLCTKQFMRFCSNLNYKPFFFGIVSADDLCRRPISIMLLTTYVVDRVLLKRTQPVS